MTTIETATGCRITVGPKGLALWDRSAHLIGYELSTPLTADERRALVAALDPGRGTAGGQWTRYEFARLDIHPLSPAGEVIDQVVAWLNAHHPKPSDDPYSTVLDQAARIHDLKADLAYMTRERDAAVARAGKAERERDNANQRCAVAESERDKWKLHHDRVDGQWAKAEREVTKLRAIERERDEWKARAEAAEARTAPGGQWTRDDFPASLPDAEGVYGPSILVPSVRRDLAAWLNAHHPKPEPYDQGGVRGADSLLYRAERERDAAVARAEQAEQLIPAYAMLDIWMALGRDSIHFDDWYDKHGYADAWAELTSAVREARTAPAVTCAHRNAVADHLWNAMVGSAKSVVRDVVAQAFVAAGIEVAVEAEQAVVDPILDKAQEFAALADWELTDREAVLLHTVAAHVLGGQNAV